jgi:hypothetical protein
VIVWRTCACVMSLIFMKCKTEISIDCRSNTLVICQNGEM